MKNGMTFLGMPGYGRASIHAARGFFRARADMTRVVKYHPGGSLLAANFNDIWCAALNHVHEGGQLDYFAMLHDDVAPEDFWLDKLVEELEANELEMLGAVVPIKDSRGMTSLALHREGDNWMPACRLSMHDVFRLPATFTSEDLGQKLLLNTGCWVIKWNQDVCRQLHFEINDRIVFNRAANRYQAQTEPEDWNFSRCAHEVGLKIGATRKVALYHHGEYRFTNDRPWGHAQFDREAVAQSPVPLVDRDGFRFPYDVEGWLTYDEGKALWRLAKGKRVLEIGSYCGRSTICLAQSADHVLAVDPHDGRATPEPKGTHAQFVINVNRYEMSHRILLLKGTTTDVHPHIDGEFDLIFIDGDHTYEAVKSDIEIASRMLKPGGLLAFHDYRLFNGEGDGRWDPGVTQAVQELLASGGELLFRETSLAVVRPPALIPQEV